MEKIKDNAYKLDLPSNYGNVSATFIVAHLTSLDVGDSRANLFEEVRKDADQGEKYSKDRFSWNGWSNDKGNNQKNERGIIRLNYGDNILEGSKKILQ